MLAVQVGGVDGGNEELRSVGVGASIGHGQQADAIVLQDEVLVGELGAVDALATTAITRSEVAALQHKLGDDTVERTTLVVKGLAGLASSLLASAKSSEVLGSLGDNVVTEDELDSASFLSVNGDVEEDNGAGRGGGRVGGHFFSCRSSRFWK